MALSFCSNLGSFEHHLSLEMMSSFQQMHDPEMATEVLMAFDGNSTLADFDPLLDPYEFCHADNYNINLLPYCSTPSDYLTYFSPEIFPQYELQSYQYPKRQKISCGNYHNYSDFAPGFFDGHLPNPSVLLPETLPEFLPPLPASSYSCDQHTPESYVKNPTSRNPTSRVSLSAQSIAARERRRKITEKTQELGKRIPGGSRLNTAEMFHAAFKYVKYLQAQIAVLQIMADKEPLMHDTKELQDHLLASPLIQEKLYSDAKCLVPKQFLQTLANDLEIQSKPLMLKDIHQLLRTNAA
ncbi:hypothetical protein I3760_09G143400 [Carya illinoinensis]|nr:hypothetical protein I3760_09G143400 [Carya illinoinensis]